MSSKAKALLLDIETAPIFGAVWSIWEQDIALNQIKSDWHVIAWAAKWLDSPASEIMYMDQRHAKNVEDDSKLLKEIWKLIDEADILITQNGKKFDIRKLNARFILNGMRPPSSFKHIDTKQIAARHFAFTSNRLEYMTDKLNTKYKKLKVTKYPGFELWKQCLAGNLDAWKEMERYNKHDVLSLEELYKKLAPWDNTVNFSLYRDNAQNICSCGSTRFQKNGFYYTQAGKYQRYRCFSCSAETHSPKNLLSKEDRAKLLKRTAR